MQRKTRSQRCSVMTMAVSRRQFLKLTGAALSPASLAACGGVDKSRADGVPWSAFGPDSTAEEVTKGLDLTGKLAVVTGCTSGIGFETMRVLAKRGAYVVGTSRSLERAEAAGLRVRGLTTPVELELSDLDSVVRCAEAIRSLNTPIDMLICNAGYRGGGNNRELVNGVERHFAVNHLGHFVFVNRLLERLFLAQQGRIVMVSSRTAYRDVGENGIDLDDLGMKRAYSDALAYGQSKLANALFSLRLSELLRGTRITSNALHPGLINTEIDRNLNAIMRFGFGLLTAVRGKTTEQGAATSCYAATHPQLGATSGQFFEDCNAVTIAESHLHNRVLAEDLMRVSEELTASYLVEQERPDWSEFENGVRGDRDG